MLTLASPPNTQFEDGCLRGPDSLGEKKRWMTIQSTKGMKPEGLPELSGGANGAGRECRKTAASPYGTDGGSRRASHLQGHLGPHFLSPSSFPSLQVLSHTHTVTYLNSDLGMVPGFEDRESEMQTKLGSPSF